MGPCPHQPMGTALSRTGHLVTLSSPSTVMAQGHRSLLDPSSRSSEPWARQRGMCWGPPAGKRGVGRILTLLFSPAKIIPVAYKEMGRDKKDGGSWLGGTSISPEGTLG